MKIGVVGSGDVGRAVGAKFAALGHQVTIGTRDPNKLADWKAEAGANAHVGSFADAAAFGEIVVVATHWQGGATENALRMAGFENFSGKIVMDITNPLDFSQGAPRMDVSAQDSAGEMIQRWLSGAKVVKVFNTVPASAMVDPASHGDPTALIAGNDADAKAKVTEVLRAFGWTDIVDLGGLEQARYLEAVTMIWVQIMLKEERYNHSFKLLRP
jgi:predicted dinucleotide-binding enzyme